MLGRIKVIGSHLISLIMIHLLYQRIDSGEDGRTYPQDMMTAPSSRANFMVLYPRPEPLP